MEALGLFEGKEDRVIPLKYSDRSKTPIEPYLSDQWFVKMGDRDDGKPGLAQMAMDAVTERPREVLPGALRKIVPRLARREARLVHQPPTLVGTSHSGVDAEPFRAIRAVTKHEVTIGRTCECEAKGLTDESSGELRDQMPIHICAGKWHESQYSDRNKTRSN